MAHRWDIGFWSMVAAFALVACGSDAPPGDPFEDDVKDESACASSRGPSMARLKTNVETFCIDRTEVTRAQYAEFLEAGAPAGPSLASECHEGAREAPDPSCMASPFVCQGEGCGNHPQSCVTFCDAQSYCAWAGKELCGPIGGGFFEDTSVGTPDVNTFPQSRLAAACGGGVQKRNPLRAYPYGSRYDRGACATEHSSTVEVGSSPGCGLLEDETVVDLSGSVAEFDALVILGSVSAYSPGFDPLFSKCEALSNIPNVESVEPFIGFRCCRTVAD